MSSQELQHHTEQPVEMSIWEVWLQQSDAHMKELTLTSSELCQAAGALSESSCLFPSWARDHPSACLPGLGPTHACALLQPFTGCVGRKDLQNQGGTWCNTLLLMGRRILHVLAALQVRKSFQTGAETLVYCFTVPYTGFLFSPL